MNLVIWKEAVVVLLEFQPLIVSLSMTYSAIKNMLEIDPHCAHCKNESKMDVSRHCDKKKKLTASYLRHELCNPLTFETTVITFLSNKSSSLVWKLLTILVIVKLSIGSVSQQWAISK